MVYDRWSRLRSSVVLERQLLPALNVRHYYFSDLDLLYHTHYLILYYIFNYIEYIELYYII